MPTTARKGCKKSTSGGRPNDDQPHQPLLSEVCQTDTSCPDQSCTVRFPVAAVGSRSKRGRDDLSRRTIFRFAKGLRVSSISIGRLLKRGWMLLVVLMVVAVAEFCVYRLLGIFGSHYTTLTASMWSLRFSGRRTPWRRSTTWVSMPSRSALMTRSCLGHTTSRRPSPP